MQLTNNLTYVKGDQLTLGFSYEKFEFDNSFNLGFYGGTFGFDIDGNGAQKFCPVGILNGELWWLIANDRRCNCD